MRQAGEKSSACRYNIWIQNVVVNIHRIPKKE
jgi:hypothetical protein